MSGWLLLLIIAIGVPVVLMTLSLCVMASRSDRWEEEAEWDYLEQLGARSGGAAFPSPASPDRSPERGVSSREAVGSAPDEKGHAPSSPRRPTP